MADHPAQTYDAVLFVSFGGPEGMDDVMPFLKNVLNGRNVSAERMLEVASHYECFGGVSPINEQNRSIISALWQELKTDGPDLPIYFGNRNWHPLLADTLRQMRDDGIKDAIAFVTSAYSSYSSCRQYLENIAVARAAVGPDAPRVHKIRPFYNHPDFIRANVEQIEAALRMFSEVGRASAFILFTAHSIPESMAQNCEYQVQLNETCQLVARELGAHEWQLAFQSRSGPPTQPWLGPDVCDYLRELKKNGVNNVVIAPIGFISDHMEVVYDLDVEAKQLCSEIGINMQRATTPGTHPAFIKMIRELILELVEPTRDRRAVGSHVARAHACEPGCCVPANR
jgi:protoporphyrin/coproporphyrin ferrochelatase